MTGRIRSVSVGQQGCHQQLKFRSKAVQCSRLRAQKKPRVSLTDLANLFTLSTVFSYHIISIINIQPTKVKYATYQNIQPL